MFGRRFLWLIIASLVVIGLSPTQASIKNRKFSLHLDLYGIQPALNDSAQVWLFSPYIGGDVQVMLSQQTGLVLSYRRGTIYNDSVSTSIFKFNNDRANRRWLINAFSIGPKFYLNRRKGSTPFFLSRVEMLIWDVKTYPGEIPVVVETSGGTSHDFKATEIGITLGLGLEQLIADRIAITTSAEFSYLTGLGTDFAQWVKNSRSRALLQFGVGISIHFGKKQRSLLEEADKHDDQEDKPQRKVYEAEIDKDSQTVFQDQSRIKDRREEAAEAIKPERGIDDEDLDGVADLIDICANTPSGAKVDSDGCPIDSDKDGVADGIDVCEGTAESDRAHVDETGCTPDSDFDGIPDYRDLCPNSSQGELVDSNGCLRDLDSDGVENSLDRCPETLKGLPVDASGCPDMTVLFARRVYHKLFNSGESKVIPEQALPLDSVIAMLKMFHEVTVTIYGYTDDVGPNDANLELSQKRADAVKAYLIRKGIERERVLATGRGETNFMASNRTRSGRELNRRIELEFKY